MVTGYLSVIVLLPLAALVWEAHKGGLSGFWKTITAPEAVAAIELTLVVSVIVALDQRDRRNRDRVGARARQVRGKSFVNTLIDLPFALPTIVAGLTLLALYGPGSPVGINVAFTRVSVVMALLFVTLPFVVRTVQPVLTEFDREMEEAAASLGANRFAIFRRVVFPNLLPAILSGVALAFARAVGEFGSIVLISGNLPFKTEVASVYIFSQVESDDPAGAAAVSVLLLVISFIALLAIGAVRRYATRHDAE